MACCTIPTTLRDLLSSQRLAVLATHHGGQPYTSLVGFAASTDFSRLWFVTPRSTRKYSNLLADGRAAMLIDNRTQRDDDFHQAMACTAVGPVSELVGVPRDQAAAVYLSQLPHLAEFIASPSCALIQMAVSRYVVVSRFQDVTEYVLP